MYFKREQRKGRLDIEGILRHLQSTAVLLKTSSPYFISARFVCIDCRFLMAVSRSRNTLFID